MSTHAFWAEFHAKRLEALRSLEREKILDYYTQYASRDELMAIKTLDDTSFFASVHRARLTTGDFTEPEKEVSRQWLIDHGYEPRGI